MYCNVLHRPLIIQGDSAQTAGEVGLARHYSTKNLFTQVPNALLARYFAEQVLFGDLEFTARRRPSRTRWSKPSWRCPGYKASPWDAEFQHIFELNCKKSFRVIIDEDRW